MIHYSSWFKYRARDLIQMLKLSVKHVLRYMNLLSTLEPWTLAILYPIVSDGTCISFQKDACPEKRLSKKRKDYA